MTRNRAPFSPARAARRGVVAVAALPVAAQVQTGSILVRVTDQQGGAVPGVTIKVKGHRYRIRARPGYFVP